MKFLESADVWITTFITIFDCSVIFVKGKPFLNYVCGDKFEFENQRRNPYILTAPHLALTVQNFVSRDFEFKNNRYFAKNIWKFHKRSVAIWEHIRNSTPEYMEMVVFPTVVVGIFNLKKSIFGQKNMRIPLYIVPLFSINKLSVFCTISYMSTKFSIKRLIYVIPYHFIWDCYIADSIRGLETFSWVWYGTHRPNICPKISSQTSNLVQMDTVKQLTLLC